MLRSWGARFVLTRLAVTTAEAVATMGHLRDARPGGARDKGEEDDPRSLARNEGLEGPDASPALPRTDYGAGARRPLGPVARSRARRPGTRGVHGQLTAGKALPDRQRYARPRRVLELRRQLDIHLLSRGAQQPEHELEPLPREPQRDPACRCALLQRHDIEGDVLAFRSIGQLRDQ